MNARLRRTHPLTLVLAAALGAVVGFLLDHALTVSGRPTFTPAVTMPALLVILAVVVLILAIPVRRASRGKARIDPFRALRIAMLAKASSILGAALGGFAVGLAAYLLSRPVAPPVGSISAVIATVIGGALLIVAALVAEHLCTIRKDDDDEPHGSDGSSAGVT